MVHDTNVEMMGRQARMRDAELRPAPAAAAKRTATRLAQATPRKIVTTF